MVLLVVIPFAFGGYGLYKLNLYYLVYSNNAMEEYSRRLSNLEKVNLGATLTNYNSYPISNFGTNIQALQNEIKSLMLDVPNDGLTFDIHEKEQIIKLNYNLNIEEKVGKIILKGNKDESIKEKIKEDFTRYKNL